MEKKKRIRLKVASPCKADWESMTGDEAIRFCGLCQKNVYQISNMSTEQVEVLLSEAGEKKCGRFYQRKDGTLVTSDCSVGLRRKRRKQAVVGMGAGVLSAIGLAMSASSPSASQEVPTQTITDVDSNDYDYIMGDMEMVEEIVDEATAPEPVEEYEDILGEIAYEPEDESEE